MSNGEHDLQEDAMTTTEVSSRRRQTRDRLVTAATQLFAEKSVEATSVEELCERAGFTRGAFYSNFDSKEELCLEIVRQRGELLLETTRKALAMIPDAPVGGSRLDEIIAKVVAVVDLGSTLDDNWVLVRGELRLYAYRNPSFLPALLEAESSALALAVPALEDTLRRQRAGLLVPIEQLLLTLDAYCERTRMDAILAGRPGDHSWRTGMERLIRAVIVLPPDDPEAVAE
jgi:AcrR family transcriptional regulator